MLAATLEDGPLNLNELAYLDQLYQAKASHWFDIVALQPLGLWTKPLDEPASGALNFRRAKLARQVPLGDEAERSGALVQNPRPEQQPEGFIEPSS